MPRKCSIWGCRSGYCPSVNKVKRGLVPDQEDSPGGTPFKQNVSIFGFPKDLEERQKWVDCFPYDFDVNKVTPYMGVCANHWPQNELNFNSSYTNSTSRVRGVPSVPPSIFPEAQLWASQKPRKQRKTSTSPTLNSTTPKSPKRRERKQKMPKPSYYSPPEGAGGGEVFVLLWHFYYIIICD